MRRTSSHARRVVRAPRAMVRSRSGRGVVIVLRREGRSPTKRSARAPGSRCDVGKGLTRARDVSMVAATQSSTHLQA
ncbi:Hypothetical protein A7982_03197 [Minicystis rosea]|nr:Hypothetical protein A7982_03197 [Minicystis rosea]